MTEPEVRSTTRELFCALTEAEVGARAAELARITTQLSELEDEKKSVMSTFKDKIDRCIVDSRSLARKVSERREMRIVKCDWHYDYQVGKATLARVDTGEVLEERPLTAEERQPALPLPGEIGTEQKCRVCGCTQEKACEVEPGHMCGWIPGEEPPLCDNPTCLRAAGWPDDKILREWPGFEDVAKRALGIPEPAADASTESFEGPVFVDDLGRRCEVLQSQDKGTGRDRFGAYRVKKNGKLLRIKDVPLYAERANAVKGLVAFAKKAGFLTLEQHEKNEKEKAG